MRATEKDKQEFDLRIYREREQVTSLFGRYVQVGVCKTFSAVPSLIGSGVGKRGGGFVLHFRLR